MQGKIETHGTTLSLSITGDSPEENQAIKKLVENAESGTAMGELTFYIRAFAFPNHAGNNNVLLILYKS